MQANLVFSRWFIVHCYYRGYGLNVHASEDSYNYPHTCYKAAVIVAILNRVGGISTAVGLHFSVLM